MRDGPGGQARLSAMPAPDGTSAGAEAIADATIPADHDWGSRARLSHGSIVRGSAMASEYAGGSSLFRPS